MKAHINMIGIITSRFAEMRDFYRDILGFKVLLEMAPNYVEFENEGVRFAISTKQVMHDVTKHPSYQEERKGQSLELAFKVDSPKEVDSEYESLIKKGAKGIMEPADMPWSQRAAFFADPDGNIHEIFTDLQT